jgi:predicted ATPase
MLVDAEILYQRGVGEQARYFFKHALIQDTAYQSLLKSTRQQYHTQIAQVLEERFPDTKANQPEVLAHHYTEANLFERAIPYWQQAGQKANQNSAYREAVTHLTKGLELLKTLPDTPERIQQELTLLIALIGPLTGMKGWGSPEIEELFTRAQVLCQKVGETPQIFPVLVALQIRYYLQGKLTAALEMARQSLHLAESTHNEEFLLVAHTILGWNWLFLGKLDFARTHVEQGLALYEPEKHSALAFLYGQDIGAALRSCAAYVSWYLGYPEQALTNVTQARLLAQKLEHPYSVAMTLWHSERIHRFRREPDLAHDYGEVCRALSGEHGFSQFLALSTLEKNWVLSEQGQRATPLSQFRGIVADLQALGTKTLLPPYLGLLAEMYGKEGHIEEGLSLLVEAMALTAETGEAWDAPELYRLKGELTLQSSVQRLASSVTSTQHQTPSTPAEAEAETCFRKAIDIAQQQQAKSLELRAAMSLARLWQSQGKHHAARSMLSDIYGWFTEGFDTKDLQEAQALLDELSA